MDDKKDKTASDKLLELAAADNARVTEQFGLLAKKHICGALVSGHRASQAMKKRYDKPLFSLFKDCPKLTVTVSEIEVCLKAVELKLDFVMKDIPEDLNISRDEVKSALFYFCASACKSYDPTKTSFSRVEYIAHYAKRSLVNAAYAELNYQRSIQGDLEDTCLEDSRKDELGNEYVPHKVTPSADFKQNSIGEAYKNIEDRDEVEFLKSVMTSFESAIAEDIQLGYSLAEIARNNGITYKKLLVILNQVSARVSRVNKSWT